MKSYLLLFFSIFFFAGMVSGQNNLIQNVRERNTFTLNGKWNAIVDPYETGYYDYRLKPSSNGFFMDKQAKDKTERVEYNFDLSGNLIVPGSWNMQREKLFLYEGSVWYRRVFDYQKQKESNRVFVYFGGANYEKDVYFNKMKLGKHIGGFTPFNYEITDLLDDKDNKLILKVDNKRKREGVPTVNTDWFNYGGITRDVFIVEVPSVFIEDYMIQLKNGSDNVIAGHIKLNGAIKKQEVNIYFPELDYSKNVEVSANGIGKFEFKVDDLELWSPDNPKLYRVKIESEKDIVQDKIGFRNISTEGDQIVLNGEPLFLRGICIHEENPLRGDRAFSKEDARILLNWAKELNCNFVRLAHYPHNEYMVRLADEMGIMVWEENPVYWTILWDNQSTFQNAKNQLIDLISRDKNRASVIIWSMANETPVSEERTEFLANLAEIARGLDNTRLISAAMEKSPVEGKEDIFKVEDPFAEYVDVVSFNQYYGWYEGSHQKLPDIEWKVPYNKPVIVSEFGAGALAGYHADKETVWSEEYQEELYEKTIEMLDNIDHFQGVTPWILADFRSPRRLLPEIQDGWNRKGLISETGNKKKAFYVLKNYYLQKENK